MNGRPLRFLAVAAIGWGALRTFALWPHAVPEPIRTLILPQAIAATGLPMMVGRRRDAIARPQGAPTRATISAAALVLSPEPPPARRRVPDPDRIALAMVGLMTLGPPRYLDSRNPQITPPVPGARPVSRPSGSRWSASAWLLLRDGSGASSVLGGGQLGGGQAGLRVAYAIGTARRVALVGRVVSPVSGKGREAAFGVEWRPTRLPLRLVAEQRFSLDGGTSGPVIGIVGGTGPARLIAGFDLETYGQAGIVRRARTEPFADGAARLTRGVARLGKARLDLGLGAWGGAQRDAQRLDIGPTIGVRVPVGNRSVRVSADWRQRVAGRAQPSSGPALTIGGDF